LARRRRADLAAGRAVADLVEAELVEPLPAAAARGGGDADRLEVARTAARGDCGHDRALLRADAGWIGGGLDVHASELAAVPRAHDGADEVVRIRRVGTRRSSLRFLDEVGHPANWNSASVVSVPSTPPRATSTDEWTPDSTRVCATRSAITSAIVETRKRWSCPAA